MYLHSGHTKRMFTRPLLAIRWSDLGSIPLETKVGLRHTEPHRKGAAGQTLAVQGHV